MFANGAQSGGDAAIRERVRALRRNVKMDTRLLFWYTTLEPALQREKNNRCRMKLETLKGSLLIFNLQSAPTRTQTGKF